METIDANQRATTELRGLDTDYRDAALFLAKYNEYQADSPEDLLASLVSDVNFIKGLPANGDADPSIPQHAGRIAKAAVRYGEWLDSVDDETSTNLAARAMRQGLDALQTLRRELRGRDNPVSDPVLTTLQGITADGLNAAESSNAEDWFTAAHHTLNE